MATSVSTITIVSNIPIRMKGTGEVVLKSRWRFLSVCTPKNAATVLLNIRQIDKLKFAQDFLRSAYL